MQGIGRHECAGIVFSAIDSIGVGCQRIDARLALQRLRQPQTKLRRSSPASALVFGCAFGLLAHGDGRFTTAQNHTGPLKCATAFGHCTGHGSLYFAHFARLTLHFVTEDIGLNAYRVCRIGCGLQRLLRGRDQIDGVRLTVIAEGGVSGLGRLQLPPAQRLCQAFRNIDLIALQNRQCIGAGRLISDRGPAGDDARIITRHVTDGQRHHARRRASQRQTTALDARQVLAHAIHLTNVSAGVQQRFVDALLVLQAQAVGGQRQQC